MGLEMIYTYAQSNETKDRMRWRDSQDDNSYHSNMMSRENTPKLLLDYVRNEGLSMQAYDSPCVSSTWTCSILGRA